MNQGLIIIKKNKLNQLKNNVLNLFKLLIFSILIVNFNKIILNTKTNNKDDKLVKIYYYVCEKFEEAGQTHTFTLKTFNKYFSFHAALSLLPAIPCFSVFSFFKRLSAIFKRTE